VRGEYDTGALDEAVWAVAPCLSPKEPRASNMSLPDRLSLLDASFLYLETSNVSMNVGGLAVLDPATSPSGMLRPDALMELLGNRIHLVPRLRQKLSFVPLNLARPVWVDDPGFRVERHVHHSELPPSATHRALLDLVQDVHASRFDRRRPLWEVHLITGLPKDQAAVLMRWHHALVDGMSGVDIAGILFDRSPEVRRLRPPPWRPATEPTGSQLISDALVEGMAQPFQSAVSLASAMANPDRVLDSAGTLVGESLSRLAAGRPPSSPFNVPVGPRRRFATATAPLRRATSIARSVGGTANDVVLSALAGALGRFLERRGEPPGDQILRAAVPFSIRRKAQRLTLGNRASLFVLDLPIGPMDERARLRAIARATKPLRAYRRAYSALPLQSGDWIPPLLHEAAVRWGAQQDVVNVIISNMRGPDGPLYMAGAPHVATYPLLPLGARLALLIGVVSLGGRMGFGFTADADAVPDVDALAAEVPGALTRLSGAASQ
jgi:diacylglycerol O-acyltransferase / wax synthase